MSSLAGRRALVSGSTQGIGRASAAALAEAGAGVVLLARNREKLLAVRESLAVVGGATHEILVADFSDPTALRATLGEYFASHPPVQILIHNTGGPPPGPAIDASPEAFVAAFAQHLLAGHALVQSAVPGMRASGYGRIINIVSTSVREPIRGLGVSNTIRAAVAGWAKTLSKELGKDAITVNNILPGSTRTGRLEAVIRSRADAAGTGIDVVERAMMEEIPLGRFADPTEVAAVVAFLASPAAGYITGVSLPVDGGRLASI
jgi:3-oxoacyl-[acyl-carrier protein] reductase